MAKQGEQLPAEGRGLVSEETKEKLKAALEEAKGSLREELTEKLIAAIEKTIAKLEEILAELKPHVEPH